MADVQVRSERAGDEAAIAEVHLAAFGDHGRAVARLVDDVRAQAASDTDVSLVAESDGRIVGHAMLSPARLDAPRRLVTVATLSPVGVLPAWQSLGVGTALVTHLLEIAEQRLVPAVFLEGDPAYYARFGFLPGRPLGYRRPSLRIPDAAFQVRPLSAHEPWMTGTLVYPDVFWRHDAVGLRELPPPV